jgi:hypothetical protein
MEHRPEAHGYRHGGFDDTDWGCCYRSVQNVQWAACGPGGTWPVPRLLRLLRRPAGEWAEPAEFARAGVFPGCSLRCFVVGRPSDDCFRSSRRAAYDQSAGAVPMEAFVPVEGSSYVIDDGISAFAIVWWQGRHWFIDPHTAYPRTRAVQLRPAIHIRRRGAARGWMVLQVARAPVRA